MKNPMNERERYLSDNPRQSGDTIYMMPLRPRTREPLVRVAPRIFRIDLPVPELTAISNSYLVLGDSRSLLIDCGCNLPEVEEALDLALSRLNVPWKSVDVFLTHSDYDHCAGLTRIGRQSMIVYAGLEDYADRHRPVMACGEALADCARRVSERHGDVFPFDLEFYAPLRDAGTDEIRVNTLHDGDELAVGTFRFKVIATPGHDAAHLCLYEPNAHLLFSGDHLIADIYPPVFLSDDDDDLAQYLESLAKVRDLDADLVLSGHNEPFTDLSGRVDAIRTHYERQLDQVRGILATGLTDPGEIAYASCCLPRRTPWEERSVFAKICLIGQTMTYLRHLVETGEYTHPELIIHR